MGYCNLGSSADVNSNFTELYTAIENNTDAINSLTDLTSTRIVGGGMVVDSPEGRQCVATWGEGIPNI